MVDGCAALGTNAQRQAVRFAVDGRSRRGGILCATHAVDV